MNARKVLVDVNPKAKSPRLGGSASGKSTIGTFWKLFLMAASQKETLNVVMRIILGWKLRMDCKTGRIFVNHNSPRKDSD